MYLIYVRFFFKYNFAVPPNIEDSLTSTDVVVREGANVTLKCRATGSPMPSVKWKRDDNSKISINKAMSGILFPYLPQSKQIKEKEFYFQLLNGKERHWRCRKYLD